MTVLKILKYGDKFLRQTAKPVSKFSKKIRILAENMIDTMYTNNGVGLAAPQVGESVRLFVIDVSDPKGPPNPIVFINPKIVKKSGAIRCNEGCLSFPEAYFDVKRYANVTVKAQDLNGRPFVMEAKDGELLARAIQHENDHLDGILFVDHSYSVFEAQAVLDKFKLPPVEKDKLIDEKELDELLNSANMKNVEE